MINKAEAYCGSSYKDYKCEGVEQLVETETVFGTFSEDNTRPVKLFEEFAMEDTGIEFIDVEEGITEHMEGEVAKKIVY
ncbi:MAG: hypothetical protein PHZ03_09285 [Syntrophomonas sp.]|nr:hypothetical protein [Syntrophomonas sp.]